ncbi:hypothetical protein HELRODRAFT_163804 [Helobdella robusta]|uniref:Endonuclease/exonuclease/phosphatase domain-containing protein n=1 Tax=Helobdella robusta TaxID=6412 RepID=T1EUH6_HELRO|nr:hypothetical protein HELRODRAFT_163804 [Helobdella robusta]ESN96708.1 hypothetical protein HELRODRAFT_163804 [Helobdella robusta]
MENSTFSCKERVKLMNGRQGPGYELCSLIKCGSHGFHSGDDDNSNSNENFNLGLLNVRSIARNVDGIYGLICDGLDVLVLTETWHGLPGNNSVSAAMPPGYCYVDFVRQHDPGHGGLVIYFRKEFGCRKINLPSFVTTTTQKSFPTCQQAHTREMKCDLMHLPLIEFSDTQIITLTTFGFSWQAEESMDCLFREGF